MTRDHVVIREARPGDIEAIGATHGAAWRMGYKEIFDPEDLTRLVKERRTIRWPATFEDPAFANTTLLVAERSAGIVGFIYFGPSRTQPDDVGEIYSFNVHPDDWGTGAATILMQQACYILAEQGRSAIHLWTYQAAGRARRFYEKTGFQPTGRTKHEGPAGGPPTTEVEYIYAIPPFRRSPGLFGHDP